MFTVDFNLRFNYWKILFIIWDQVLLNPTLFIDFPYVRYMYIKLSTLILLIPIFSYSQTNDIIAEKSFYIINTQKDIGLNYWNIVNDDVMGGISKSYLSLNDEKNLVFNGYLSLDNNGGFFIKTFTFNRRFQWSYFKIFLPWW